MNAFCDQDASNLDLLRALAVSAVFADHLALTFIGQSSPPSAVYFHFLGHAGVLMFFVHTSMVLMFSMQRMRLAGRQLFRSFMIRRSFRIYPLSVAAVVLMPIFHVPLFSDGLPYHWVGWKNWLANLALVQNLSASPQVLDPLWSLPFEVQMYCVLPLIFLTVASQWRRALLLEIAAVLSILAALWVTARWNLPLRGLATLRFAPCFLGGVLAYALSKRVRPRFPALFWALFLVAAVGAYVLGGAWASHGRTPMQGTIPGTVCGWVLCCALGFAIPQFREIRSRWVKRASHEVATYSYGIYLSHVPVFWFCFCRLKDWPFACQCLLAAALSVLVPLAAFHAIEKPLIDLGKRLANRGRLPARLPRPEEETSAAA